MERHGHLSRKTASSQMEYDGDDWMCFVQARSSSQNCHRLGGPVVSSLRGEATRPTGVRPRTAIANMIS